MSTPEGLESVLRKILIVEDEPIHLRLIQGVLKGYIVRTAQDITTARAALDAEPDFDLVVLDQRLPLHAGERSDTAHGAQFLHELQNQLDRSFKIIVVSAYQKNAEVADAIASGVDRVFDKPFALLEFREQVDRIWRT